MSEKGSTSEPLFTIRDEDRKEMVKEWEQYFETIKGDLVPHEKVLEALEKASDPEAFRGSDQPTFLPGSVSFGNSPEILYIVYAHMMGEEEAQREIEHELEHAKVYRSHDVPVNFGLVISKLPTGNYFVIPLISPEFPEEMGPEERQKIGYEANMAVSEKSERDALSIKKHESQETEDK